VTALKTKHT